MRVDGTIVDRFRSLESELASRFPDARAEAEALGREIANPLVANADAIWEKVWDKPLYANTRVQIGKVMIKKLAPYMPQAWQHWGDDKADFKISKIAKGSGSAAFEAVTGMAKKIRQDTNIAMHRLFAIQGAAAALRHRSGKSAAPYADLVDRDPGGIVPMVKHEMGPGWGHITVLHFLTDLGLACKPDLHLVRTFRTLGMGLPLSNRRVPSLAEAIMINRCVRSLVEGLDGYVTPARLRYVDKTLMDISLCGLISEG